MWFLACAPPAVPPPAEELLPLAAPRLARRMSLDLRGVLPTRAELDAVEADPASLEGLRDAWLADPRFEARLVHLLQERWYTRVDTFDIRWYDYDLSESDEYVFERAVGEEPLRLVARVVAEDQPWSAIVTADWTMTHPILAPHWPVDYPAGESDWQPTHYTDGRPAAGVLATNGLWWRYTTNASNMNRGRAAAIGRILLCEDVLARPVSFSFTDTTIVDPAVAAQSDPACLSCHASLDPLAASLFGFWWLNMYSAVEETRYHPERERLYTELGVEPAWFGTPIDGLSDLGWYVASDPRFYRCAVESFAASYWRRETTIADFDTIEALRRAFVAQGAHPQALIAALLETEEYRTGAVTPGSTAADRVRSARMLTPDQMASSIEELTGFRWTEAGVDRMDADATGYRLLAGGVDGESVFVPQRDPGLTWSLVVQRLAQAAGSFAAGTLGTTGLLEGVTVTHLPGEPVFDETLEALHWRLYATRAEPAWVADVGGLWTEVASVDGPEAAWASVVAALLRDPEFVLE